MFAVTSTEMRRVGYTFIYSLLSKPNAYQRGSSVVCLESILRGMYNRCSLGLRCRDSALDVTGSRDPDRWLLVWLAASRLCLGRIGGRDLAKLNKISVAIED